MTNPALDHTIAYAMTALPFISPETVGYSMHSNARVAGNVNTDTSLKTFLVKSPLTLVYNIPEPLSVTPPSDLALITMITDLRAEVSNQRIEFKGTVASLEGKVASLESKVTDLQCEVNLLRHLFNLGFDPYTTSVSRSQFVAANLAALVAVLGVSWDEVRHCFEHYYKDGVTAAHTTTSVSVANAIIHLDMDARDLSMWKSIFQRTFNKSISEQLSDGRGVVWMVDARWRESAGSRFTLIDRGRRGQVRSWELN